MKLVAWLGGLRDEGGGFLGPHYLPGNGPDKADQLPCHGHTGLGFEFAPGLESAIASSQSLLGFPGDGLYRRTGLLGFLL